MTDALSSHSRQAGSGNKAAAPWTLAPGQAASLVPRRDASLRVRRGQVWVTFDGPHAGHGNESGDHFLKAGDQLRVRAGQRVVLEPFDRRGTAPAQLEWVTLAAPHKAPPQWAFLRGVFG